MIKFLMVSPKCLGINPQAKSSSLLKQTNPPPSVVPWYVLELWTLRNRSWRSFQTWSSSYSTLGRAWRWSRTRLGFKTNGSIHRAWRGIRLGLKRNNNTTLSKAWRCWRCTRLGFKTNGSIHRAWRGTWLRFNTNSTYTWWSSFWWLAQNAWG